MLVVVLELLSRQRPDGFLGGLVSLAQDAETNLAARVGGNGGEAVLSVLEQLPTTHHKVNSRDEISRRRKRRLKISRDQDVGGGDLPGLLNEALDDIKVEPEALSLSGSKAALSQSVLHGSVERLLEQQLSWANRIR